MSNNSVRPFNPHIQQAGHALSSLESEVIACLRSLPIRDRVGLRNRCRQRRNYYQAEVMAGEVAQC
ncbi:MAG: hypothetical protein JRG71_04660 [Deltaproteobacteria bacterium]|nr:hypothetical protein [Deltaproteobacteria bacterium]